MVKENLKRRFLNEEKRHAEQEDDNRDHAPFGGFGEIAPKRLGAVQSLRIDVCRMIVAGTHVMLSLKLFNQIL